MGRTPLKDLVKGELETAFAARRAGNEGKARVCARRAAGWALGPYIRSQEGRWSSRNALRALAWLQADRGSPEPLREAAGRLGTRIRRDHTLPFNEDVLADAVAIVSHFLGEDIDLSAFSGGEASS
jgi:hypothetical protein